MTWTPVLCGRFETRKTKRAVRERYKINLEIPMVNQASLGTKSLRLYGDPRFGTLSQITLYWSKIYVLKMSSKAGMVHLVVVKSAGISTLWTDFKYFKKEFIKNYV